MTGPLIDPDALDRLLRSLADGRSKVGDGWRVHEGTVAAGEAGIGGDVLGQAFRATYDTNATAMREAAQRVLTTLDDAGATGTRALRGFLGIDVDGEADVRGGG